MPNTATQTPRYTIKLRAAAWTELRKMTNTESDQALAAVLGVNRTTVYRVTAGDAEPSSGFIAAALAKFRFASFDRLFEWTVK